MNAPGSGDKVVCDDQSTIIKMNYIYIYVKSVPGAEPLPSASAYRWRG